MPKKKRKFSHFDTQNISGKRKGNLMKKLLFALMFALTVGFLVSCSTTPAPSTETPDENPTAPQEPETPVSNKADYNSFSLGLPSWSEFSPLEPSVDEPKVGAKDACSVGSVLGIALMLGADERSILVGSKLDDGG